MTNLTPTELTAWADKIDARLGPIPGHDADRIAVVLREAAKQAAVCEEIRSIVDEYRKQISEARFGTPGGLEHMGDVWRLLLKWEGMLG